MSELQAYVTVSYPGSKVPDALRDMLRNFDAEASHAAGYARELQLLDRQLGLDAHCFFAEQKFACEVGPTSSLDGVMSIRLVGEETSGREFLLGLIELCLALKPYELTSVAYRPQLGECTVHDWDGKEM